MINVRCLVESGHRDHRSQFSYANSETFRPNQPYRARRAGVRRPASLEGVRVGGARRLVAEIALRHVAADEVRIAFRSMSVARAAAGVNF